MSLKTETVVGNDIFVVEVFGVMTEHTKNNKYHRIDGPAIEWYDGHSEWYYEGEYINCNSQEEFGRLIKMKAFW